MRGIKVVADLISFVASRPISGNFVGHTMQLMQTTTVTAMLDIEMQPTSVTV